MKTRFQFQMAFASAFRVFTSGVFLSGLAAIMGAGDVLISYISVIMNICGAVIIFFAPFVERFRSRKKTTMVLTALSKFITVMIVFIPMEVPENMQLFFFMSLIITAFTLQAQAQVSLNNWLIHFVEHQKRGRYISLRMTVELVITIMMSVAAGSFVDSLEARYFAFLVIFAIAFLLAWFELFTMMGIDDVIVSPDAKTKYSFKESVLTPLRDKEFMAFVIYIALFYFLLYIADSYTTVYLLRYLELSYTQITVIQQVFMSAPQLFLLFIWGRASDKRGHKYTLHMCLWFFTLELLFVMLSSKETALIFLPIAFTAAAIANSGFNVSMFNRRYELIPEEGRIVYDNFFHAAVGIALILGPMTGGLINRLATESGILSGIQFGELRVLYAVALVGIIVLQSVMFFKSRPKQG